MFKNSVEPVTINTNDASEVQYRIHEGLFVAELLSIPDYSTLRKRWKVRWKERYVILTPLTAESSRVEYENLTDAYEVVEKLSRLKDSNCEIVFLNCPLSDDDKKMIKNWCLVNKRIFTEVEETGVIHVT